MTRGGSHPCALGCDCRKHAKPTGPASPNWAGDKITRKAAHTRVTQVRGAARTHDCFFHAERGDQVPALDWAMIHETEGLEVTDYIPLCRSCHLRYDEDARSPQRSAAGRKSLAKRTRGPQGRFMRRQV